MRNKKTPWIFPKDRRKKRSSRGAVFRIWLVTIFVSAIIVFGGAFYLIFYSGVFAPDVIYAYPKDGRITRTNLDLTKEIARAATSFVPSQTVLARNNLFFLNEKDIEEMLLDSFPEVSHAVVRKHYLARLLEIIFEERIPVAIWCNVQLEFSEPKEVPGESTDLQNETGGEEGEEGKVPMVFDKCFYIDKEGFLFSEAPESRGSLVALIRDYGNYDDVRLNSRFLSREEVGFLLGIKNALRGAFPQWGVKEFIHEGGEFTLVTNQGWKVFLNREYSPEKHMGILKELFQDSDLELSEYIDLRIANKVYYK